MRSVSGVSCYLLPLQTGAYMAFVDAYPLQARLRDEGGVRILRRTTLPEWSLISAPLLMVRHKGFGGLLYNNHRSDLEVDAFQSIILQHNHH